MNITNRVLILFAHPNHDASRVHSTLRKAVEHLPGVTLHDLYENYPHFFIDVKYEQKLLLEHEIVILQHPMYWYSCPAIIKEWLDMVLEQGWAYGEGGDKLIGKFMMQAISTNGPENFYQRAGKNNFTIIELLRPFEQTAHLCGIIPLPPFLVQGAKLLTEQDLVQYSQRYAELVTNLVAGNLPPAFNSYSG